MIEVRSSASLSAQENSRVEAFLASNPKGLSPYHFFSYVKVLEDVFGYPNRSLVAMDADSGSIVGVLPQWIKGGTLESVPWRDRGGPICKSDEALKEFIQASIQITKDERLKGFLWKDFETPLLKTQSSLVDVVVDLGAHQADSYWERLPSRVRNKVRIAEKAGLVFSRSSGDLQAGLRDFYFLFEQTRRRLGVPVYPAKLFESYFQNYPKAQIELFNVVLGKQTVASLILLIAGDRGIDAFSCSSALGRKIHANDFLLFNVIRHCLLIGLKTFDFGSDSPLQTSLIEYKEKWLGARREVKNSHFGGVKEQDHNQPVYELAKFVFRRLPGPLYRLASGMVVR